MNSLPARSGNGNGNGSIAPMGYQAAPGTLNAAIQIVDNSIAQLKALRTFIKAELKPGIDYGKIPGCGDKPTLFLAGAQKTAMFFNGKQVFDNQETELSDGHLEVVSRVSIVSRSSGEVLSTGVGSCCTLESKYRYRTAKRSCPKCGSIALINDNFNKAGGFVCYGNKGGCGHKFAKDDPAITQQVLGQIPNPDIYDVRNTVRKMAMKRGGVHAAMNLGCLSEMFTQDIEDTFTDDDFERYVEAQATIEHTASNDATFLGRTPTRSAAQSAPPRSATRQSNEIGVFGRDGAEYDERPFHEVASKAAAAIDVKCFTALAEVVGENETRKRHVPVTVELLLGHLVNRAVQSLNAIPPKTFKVADMLGSLNKLYKSDRHWMRMEINGFGNDLIAEVGKMIPSATPQAPQKPAQDAEPAPQANTLTLAQAIPHEVNAAVTEFKTNYPNAAPEARQRLPKAPVVQRALLGWAAKKGLCDFSVATKPAEETAMIAALDDRPDRDETWQEMYRLVDTQKDAALAHAKAEIEGDYHDVDLPV
jgi:hypothetical protein